MDAMECLLGRQSTPAANLVEPPPCDEEILQLLRSAMRAPDHGALRPWRFLAIRGERRKVLGDIFADSLTKRDPDAKVAEVEKARGKPLRAPLVMAVWAEITENHPKVILARNNNQISVNQYSDILNDAVNDDDRLKAKFVMLKRYLEFKTSILKVYMINLEDLEYEVNLALNN